MRKVMSASVLNFVRKSTPKTTDIKKASNKKPFDNKDENRENIWG